MGPIFGTPLVILNTQIEEAYGWRVVLFAYGAIVLIGITLLSALVRDLDERGLLAETLVVVNAEFGRTPQINRSAGRDHWPWVYSLVLAGPGVQGGTVYGASDNSAAHPTSTPHDPADFVATLYHLLGVSPETQIHDANARPHTVIIGQPITGVLA